MRKVQKSEIDEMCEAHKLCSGSAPVSVPRITCNCGRTWTERMVGGTGSDNRAGKISPTVGVDSFESWWARPAEERGHLSRNFWLQLLRLRERRKVRWKRGTR